MTEHDEEYKALYRELLQNVSASIPELQDYPGLDVAGFLLVALGHLVKAKERLDQEPPSRARYNAQFGVRIAANHVRFALKVLDEQKEETCEKS